MVNVLSECFQGLFLVHLKPMFLFWPFQGSQKWNIIIKWINKLQTVGTCVSLWVSENFSEHLFYVTSMRDYFFRTIALTDYQYSVASWKVYAKSFPCYINIYENFSSRHITFILFFQDDFNFHFWCVTLIRQVILS